MQEAELPAKVQKPQANATPTACCASKSQKPRAKPPKRIAKKKKKRQQIVMPRQAEQATGQQEGLQEGLLESEINWGGKNDAGWRIDLCASCDKTGEPLSRQARSSDCYKAGSVLPCIGLHLCSALSDYTLAQQWLSAGSTTSGVLTKCDCKWHQRRYKGCKFNCCF